VSREKPKIPLSYLAEMSKNDPNRHAGVPSSECHCGLIHDDELQTDVTKREKVVDLLGAKCANPNCRHLNEDGTLGCIDRRLLHVDHVYDDGALERRTAKQRAAYWTRILRDVLAGTDRYQLLCANCNWLKRYTHEAWNFGGRAPKQFGGYHASR
jgi:hypothetical protein